MSHEEVYLLVLGLVIGAVLGQLVSWRRDRYPERKSNAEAAIYNLLNICDWTDRQGSEGGEGTLATRFIRELLHPWESTRG